MAGQPAEVWCSNSRARPFTALCTHLLASQTKHQVLQKLETLNSNEYVPELPNGSDPAECLRTF